MPEPDDPLRELLGTDPPGSVQALPAQLREELADILRDAQRRQNRSMEEAFAATLKHVPFPVRKIVKKVLIG
jgi:hypothetical protein